MNHEINRKRRKGEKERRGGNAVLLFTFSPFHHCTVI
jgi:hypothetical protein